MTKNVKQIVPRLSRIQYRIRKKEGKDNFYTQLEMVRTLSHQFKERDFPGNKYCETFESCLDNVIRIII